MSNPIQDLAFAYHDAMFNRFSDIVYQDRDWDKYYKWRDKLKKEELANAYKSERETGATMHQESLVTKKRKPTEHETSVTAMFLQTWGSTALGFGGAGGKAITSAYSIVIECNGEYAVYFGSQFAYLVKGSKQAFFADIEVMQLESVKEAVTRYA
jgi:hypothetical protein